MAVLTALTAESAGATVAVISGYAGISAAAPRKALIAHEQVGAATGVKGSRPGLPDTWKPAGRTAPVPLTEDLRTSTIHGGQPATAEGGAAETDTERGPDPAVTAEVARNILAIAQTAGEAGRALAAEDLDAALNAAREQAAQGRRVLKAAAPGRRGPATRPGALRDLVEDHLRKFPSTAFTLH